MPHTAKSLSDIQMDAVRLHGMLEGLDILLNEETGNSPLHNAIYAISAQSVVLADNLAEEIESASDTARANGGKP